MVHFTRVQIENEILAGMSTKIAELLEISYVPLFEIVF